MTQNIAYPLKKFIQKRGKLYIERNIIAWWQLQTVYNKLLIQQYYTFKA